MGGVKALRVDADTMAVSHYIVSNAGTGSFLVLPFDKALAVGDTFMTVQSRDDFLSVDDAESTRLLQEGYALLLEEAYSKTGNRLGKVQKFEFDTVHGSVTKLVLDNQAAFLNQSFIFFSSEFVFVDDGTPTAAELRNRSDDQASDVTGAGAFDAGVAEAADTSVPTVSLPLVSPVVPEESVGVTASEAVQNEGASVYETVVETTVEEEIIVEISEDIQVSDEEIKEFLVGAVLNADVESEDGEFKAAKDTVLTLEIIEDAVAHDALLLLTVNVDV